VKWIPALPAACETPSLASGAQAGLVRLLVTLVMMLMLKKVYNPSPIIFRSRRTIAIT
jgi:hypothetical protein